jgi:2-oxoglutarate ferredoxin oxidoreductase subunit alpha
MYALGILYWMFHRDLEPTEKAIVEKFGKKPDLLDANLTAMKAGYAYGRRPSLFQTAYRVPPAPMRAGHVPQHHGQPGPGARVVAGARSWGLQGCSSAATRSRRRPTSCTSCRLQAPRRHHLPGRGRDRRVSARRDRRLVRRHLGITTTSGPGHRAEDRSDRAWR